MNALERRGWEEVAADRLEVRGRSGQAAAGRLLAELTFSDVVGRERGCAVVGGRARGPSTERHLRIVIACLREALADIGLAGAIQNIYGRGYRLLPDHKPAVDAFVRSAPPRKEGEASGGGQ